MMPMKCPHCGGVAPDMADIHNCPLCNGSLDGAKLTPSIPSDVQLTTSIQGANVPVQQPSLGRIPCAKCGVDITSQNIKEHLDCMKVCALENINGSIRELLAEQRESNNIGHRIIELREMEMQYTQARDADFLKSAAMRGKDERFFNEQTLFLRMARILQEAGVAGPTMDKVRVALANFNPEVFQLPEKVGEKLKAALEKELSAVSFGGTNIYVGSRVAMCEEKQSIPKGTKGTVSNIYPDSTCGVTAHVKWDNGKEHTHFVKFLGTIDEPRRKVLGAWEYTHFKVKGADRLCHDYEANGELTKDKTLVDCPECKKILEKKVKKPKTKKTKRRMK